MVLGWSSLMCAMFLFFGIVLFMLGIVGEYIGKIMLNLNKTPQYVVRETINVTAKKPEIKPEMEQQMKPEIKPQVDVEMRSQVRTEIETKEYQENEVAATTDRGETE